MIADLEPYSAMKESGVEWLGEVPEHWEVRQLGRIGKFSKGNGGTKEDEEDSGVPCVRYGDLYTQHRYFISRARSSVSLAKSETYTPIHFGDVLFAGSGETIEEIGKSAVSLISEPACCGGDVIIFRPSMAIDAKFLGFATDCPQAEHQKSCMGRGITVMHIYGDELKYLSVALPTLREQTAIVRYLDHVERRVRSLVRAKRKLIALLTEQKQAIIHRAVTRGLDPNVSMKDSGVERLGQVPEHWDVVKLSRWFRCTSGSTPFRGVGAYYGGDIPWVKTGELLDSEIHEAAESITQAAMSASSMTLLPVNTLLIAMYGQGQTRGRTGLLKTEATVNQACLAILPNPERVLPQYLQLWFIAQYPLLRYISEARNSTQPNLNAEIIKSQKIVIPPRAEQERILKAVGIETETVMAAMSRAKREIGLLDEYRTRLLADVVTGKLDVREVAAALSEVDPLDIEDDLDNVIDTDSEAEIEDINAVLDEAEA